MKIALLVAALAAQATAPAQAPTAETPADERAPWTESDQPTPNAFQSNPGCTPIVVQVSGEDRRYEGNRLDQQPPARMLLAVDRQVNGCREVTFVNEQDRPSRLQAR